MQHTIEIIDDQMCLMDADGNSHDGAVLTTYREAKRQIDQWTREFTINVADAYNQLADHFSRR